MSSVDQNDDLLLCLEVSPTVLERLIRVRFVELKSLGTFVSEGRKGDFLAECTSSSGSLLDMCKHFLLVTSQSVADIDAIIRVLCHNYIALSPA